MTLPASVHLVTVLRGPFLLPPDNTLVLRTGDVLVVIGLQEDLTLFASEFTEARSAKPA
jgi:Trk K+ transport system NAD-binding subunit